MNRPLRVVRLGASHVHRQAKDKLVEGETFLFSPFKFIHCVHEREVFILLGAFDNERPGRDWPIDLLNANELKLFHNVRNTCTSSKINSWVIKKV